MKGLLVHVAIDSSNLGVVGPLFYDQSFEFIPLNNVYGYESRTYSQVQAKNSKYGKTLSDFLPLKYQNTPIHFDPDFTSYTYGQHGGVYPRIRSLENLQEGDYIFFLSSLAPYNKKIYEQRDTTLQSYQRGKKNKYIIGFFKVTGVANVFSFTSSLKLAITLSSIGLSQDQSEPMFSEEDVKEELNDLENFGYIVRENGRYRLTNEFDGVARSGEILFNNINEMWPEDEESLRSLLHDGLIDIQLLSGKVNEENVRDNHHYKRLKPLDIDWFSIIIGDPNNSKLLEKAIPLTERYENKTFILNSLGQKIRNRKTDTLRGTRKLTKEGVELLLDKMYP